MTALRWVCALATLAALVLVSAHSSALSARPPVAAPCSASAVTSQLTRLAPNGVVAYGCEGHWAYAWVVAGSGTARVAVTDLLSFDGRVWRPVPRQQSCSPATLPAEIYRRACFSN
ncbi:MAG: hypothetical protein ACP5OV_06030 [Acidimicrobiales bacterium]